MRLGTERAIGALLIGVLAGFGAAAEAQDDEEERQLGFANNTELSLVTTSGNARSTTFGLRNLYRYVWPRADFSWEAGWLRVASQDGDRYAVITTPPNFEIVEPDLAVDNQRLFSKVGYQRQFYGRHGWFANFDAVKDEPANINRQMVTAGGLVTTWRDTERLTFLTRYGLSYTDEDLELDGLRRFAGYRLFYGLNAKPTEVVTVDSELTFDGSFEESDDVRADSLNSVSVALNSNIALSASVRLLVRNLPALEELDLQLPFTEVDVVVGTVEVPKEKLDTNFTTSLVISF